MLEKIIEREGYFVTYVVNDVDKDRIKIDVWDTNYSMAYAKRIIRKDLSISNQRKIARYSIMKMPQEGDVILLQTLPPDNVIEKGATYYGFSGDIHACQSRKMPRTFRLSDSLGTEKCSGGGNVDMYKLIEVNKDV